MLTIDGNIFILFFIPRVTPRALPLVIYNAMLVKPAFFVIFLFEAILSNLVSGGRSEEGREKTGEGRR